MPCPRRRMILPKRDAITSPPPSLLVCGTKAGKDGEVQSLPTLLCPLDIKQCCERLNCPRFELGDWGPRVEKEESLGDGFEAAVYLIPPGRPLSTCSRPHPFRFPNTLQKRTKNQLYAFCIRTRRPPSRCLTALAPLAAVRLATDAAAQAAPTELHRAVISANHSAVVVNT